MAKRKILITFLASLTLIFGGFKSAFANNYNILSSSITKKELEKQGKPQFLVDGILNFSASAQEQSSIYARQYLPDGISKNQNHNKFSFGNDSQIFLKLGIKTESNLTKKQKKQEFSGAESEEENSKKPNQKLFGAIAKFEMNYSSKNRSESPNLDQSFLFAENAFGRFEFGNYFAVNQKMKAGPAQIARGAGGINGKYLEQVNFPSLGVGNSGNSSTSICSGKFGDSACQNLKLPRFITLAQSPVGHGGYAKSFYRRGANNNYQIGSFDYKSQGRSSFRAIKDDSYDGIEDATKFSYYSPRISGFQAGLSYAFDSKSLGATKQTALDVDYLRLRNIFSFGLNYSQNFDNFELKIATTGEHGKSQNSQFSSARRNLNSYDISTTLSYFGFSLSAAKGFWGKSLMPKNGIYSCNYSANKSLAEQNCAAGSSAQKSAGYFSYGLAYEIGPFATSLTSIRSQFMSNLYNAVSVGFDYRFKRDLVGYIEATSYKFQVNQPSAVDISNQNSLANSANQLANNSGKVFLAGFYYIF